MWRQSLTKRMTTPEIIKELDKTLLGNDMQTIKDHSTFVNIKTIQITCQVLELKIRKLLPKK